MGLNLEFISINLKLRDLWKKIRTSFQENFSKNFINIGLMIYYIVYAIFTLSTLLGAGELSLSVFWKVLVLALNLPVLVVLSLVLVGKWKGSQVHVAMLEKIYQVQLELELKKQEIEHLKLIQQQFTTIGDLNERLQKQKEEYTKELAYQNEMATYKILLAAKEGKVPEVICSVKEWNDTNKTIEIIERKKTSEEESRKDDAPTE